MLTNNSTKHVRDITGIYYKTLNHLIRHITTYTILIYNISAQLLL